MSNSGHNPKTTANRSTTTHGVSHEDRQQILLDDLRVEIARLAEAIEKQNRILAARDDVAIDAEPPAVADGGDSGA